MKSGLLRYFVLASGVVFFLALGSILYVYENSATKDLFKLAESQNITLATVIANDVRKNVPRHFSSFDADELAAPGHVDHVADIDAALKRLLRDLPVHKVKIFLDNLTIYSTDHRDIGAVKSSRKFSRVSASDSPTSKMFVADGHEGVNASVRGRDIMETYVPFGAFAAKPKDSRRLTLEVYTDVTPLVAQISATKTNLIVALLIIFAVLYGILILIVHKANSRSENQSKLIHLLNRTASDANSAASLEEAMQKTIGNLCAHTGWPVGHAFHIIPESPGVLVSSHIWHMSEPAQFAAFRKDTEKTTFEIGVGLPGRVMATGKPGWISDISKDGNFLRARVAAESGLGAGFACPVMVGKRMVAVLEFFAAEVVPPDPALLDTLDQVGIQLGRMAERKEAEADIRDNQDRLRDFAGAASDWFFEMDGDYKVTYLSERYTEVTGLPAEDLLGKTWADAGVLQMFKPDGRTRESVDLRARRPFRNYNYSRIMPDGDVVWVSVNGTPYFTSDGAFAGYRGTGTNVTTLKQREMALRDSEERFRAFIDNSPSAILIKDVEGNYLSVNKCWHEWFNPNGAEIDGITVRDFYPADFAGQIIDIDRQVIETGAPVERELATPFADGTVRPALVQKFPIFDQDGKICAIGGAITDITKQRNAEEQLRQSQKMEAVGQLTGGIAHDFNNLLGVIIGNLDFLAEELKGNADHAELVDAATKAALSGASLNRQLLAFSRNQPLVPQAIDLNAHVSDLHGMLSRTLGETIMIETIQHEKLWACEADPGQVESALLNLAINARDAMPAGGTLSIETANVRLKAADVTAETMPGEYVTLTVTDTGTGMPPDVVAHVFEPFFTTKDVGKGSGLGLSMVFGFARQSGGNVTVSSAVGAGTTVTLYLPRARPSAPIAEDPGTAARSEPDRRREYSF